MSFLIPKMDLEPEQGLKPELKSWMAQNPVKYLTSLVLDTEAGTGLAFKAIEALLDLDRSDKSDIWDSALLTIAVFSLAFFFGINIAGHGPKICNRQSGLIYQWYL